MSEPAAASGFPRLTYLRIRNYRALRDVELRDLTPLTVFIGPNGSGKSTVLDALAFLAEAVSGNLQQAWEKRNRFAGMRTRGSDGPIEFEVRILISPELSLKYSIQLSEVENSIVCIDEQFLKEESGKTYPLFISEREGKQQMFSIISTELPNLSDESVNNRKRIINDIEYVVMPNYANISLPSIVLSTKRGGEIISLAKVILLFLTSYRYTHLTDDHLKGYSDAGPREKLSANGDNLPNVLYYLHTKHPEVLAKITAQMRRWVPSLADIITEITSDERLLLRFKDAPFEKPLPAQYMSEGTMRLAALLTLLYEPDATGMLGLEEPENELHPRLLPRLAEELIKATETRQLFVATHSPALLNAFEPEQVWILHRGADGYTQATRTADIPNVKELVEDGSPLGYLWSSNSFSVGDPLAPRAASTDAH